MKNGSAENFGNCNLHVCANSSFLFDSCMVFCRRDKTCFLIVVEPISKFDGISVNLCSNISSSYIIQYFNSFDCSGYRPFYFDRCLRCKCELFVQQYNNDSKVCVCVCVFIRRSWKNWQHYVFPPQIIQFINISHSESSLVGGCDIRIKIIFTYVGT